MEEYGNACRDLVGKPEEKCSPERTSERLGDNGTLSKGWRVIDCIRCGLG